MPASTRRIYVDANVLLAYLGNETGRAEIVQALLDEARRSEIEIITSVLVNRRGRIRRPGTGRRANP